MTQPPTILPQSASSTLVAALLESARPDPNRLAIEFSDQALSYAQFVSLVQTCRGRLQSWGIRPGDRVAALCLGHPLQLAALFAVAELGAIWVPLNFRLATPEWRQVLDDCQPRCLLADPAWWEAAQALAVDSGLPIQPLEVLGKSGPTVSPQPVRGPAARDAGIDTPVLLVYTSGTTGRPKGAVHTQGNLLANARAAIAAQDLAPSDRVLTLLPLFHVGGLCIQTLPALLAGACVVLHPRFDPQQALVDLERRRITLTLMVPAVMKAVVEHPHFRDAQFTHLRALWAGSSVLPDELVQIWLHRGIPVCNVYGATETGPFSIALGPQHAASHLGSCGWPALGVEARLQSLPGTQVDATVGEVCLRGPAIVRRYWPERPALDDQGWFHTGDLARKDQDLSWRIVGRAKDMIISGGENIYPAEIENILARHPAVAECAAVGLPDPRWGERVVAVVVLRPGLEPSDDDLLDPVRSALARYKHPRQLLRLNSLPKTALGKVQKERLVASITEPAGTKAEPSADSPRSP
ncbi:MAG: AMP-binding protein [Alphaproteobacteria bacterium]|nr:AMP-binding protein [Alphaproteobacteria bacterium]